VKELEVGGLWAPTFSSSCCDVENGLRPRTKVEQTGLVLTGSSFFKGILLGAISFTGFAARSLETETELVKEPLALPDAKRYGVFLGKMVREQQSVPQVLVVSQFSRRTTDFFAQLSHAFSRQSGWASRMVPVQQTGEPFRSKPLDPIFNGPRRISIQASRVMGTGSIQDVENSMKPVKVASFRSTRYFVLNGSLEYFSIRYNCPSHWEPPILLYSQYTQYLS
jgi:hypothetical protein